MTAQALTKMAQLTGDWLKAGAEIVVSDGQQSASAPALIGVDGAQILATAVFDEEAANFHWTSRILRSTDGTVVDELEEDYGTKKLGAVWTLEVPLEVVAP